MICLRNPTAAPVSLQIQGSPHPPFAAVSLSVARGTRSLSVAEGPLSALESRLLQTPTT
jgi:hypothetical protein